MTAGLLNADVGNLSILILKLMRQKLFYVPGLANIDLHLAHSVMPIFLYYEKLMALEQCFPTFFLPFSTQNFLKFEYPPVYHIFYIESRERLFEIESPSIFIFEQVKS